MRSPVTGHDLTPMGLRREAAAALTAAGWEIAHDDLTTMGVATDYLMGLGYDRFDAEGAANDVRLAHPTSAPHMLPEAGPCDACGEPDCDHNDGTGRYLCGRHWDSY